MNSQLSRHVLVVDDDPFISKLVQQELTTPPLGRYRYEVEVFSDPAQALERARSQSFDVVISDNAMPGMTGLELLKSLAELQPDCACIVLSGQTDMDALTKMVNETHIYRFIPKPWHDYFLKGSVAQAIEFKTVLEENRRSADLVRDHDVSLPQLQESNVDQILIVDDEPDALEQLSRVLSSHSRLDDLFASIGNELGQHHRAALEEGKIVVHTASSPLQAIKMAETTGFSCILADQGMPEMKGVDLLRHFLEHQPDCARILISGGHAKDDLINAVDTAHIFGFIAKPWQDYELKSCVAQALAYRRISLDNRVLAEMVRKVRLP